MTATTGDPGPTPTDDELMAELRAVLSRSEPVPDSVRALSRSLLSWRDPDAELAELAADSRQPEQLLRGDTDVLLHFRAGAVEITVQLSPTGDGRHRLVGQVEPPAPGTVEIRRPAGRTPVAVDERGRFAAGGLPSGPLSLRWRPEGDGLVDTPWHLL
jgi:hypothetical protein